MIHCKICFYAYDSPVLSIYNIPDYIGLFSISTETKEVIIMKKISRFNYFKILKFWISKENIQIFWFSNSTLRNSVSVFHILGKVGKQSKYVIIRRVVLFNGVLHSHSKCSYSGIEIWKTAEVYILTPPLSSKTLGKLLDQFVPYCFPL